MTEYDYSPEAYERYLATQNRIARWVDNTMRHEPRNPFTPATPHVQALRELENDEKHSRRHKNRDRESDTRSSSRHSSKHRHRDRHDRDRDSSSKYPSSKHTDQPSTVRPSGSRHRSASHPAMPTHRPPPLRAQTSPVVHDYDYHSSSSNPSPTKPTYSRRSSRTSSTTLPNSGSTTHFPQSQLPYSHPRRSNTTPAGYGGDHKYSQPYPFYPSKQQQHPVVVPIPNSSGHFAPPRGKSFDLVNQPQLPYTAYQTPSPTKQAPLLKRLFVNLTGGIKSSGSRSGGKHQRRGSY